jgi:hypothetical protein
VRVSFNLPGRFRDFAGGWSTLQIGAPPATVRDALAPAVSPTKPAPRTAIFVMANVSPAAGGMQSSAIVRQAGTHPRQSVDGRHLSVVGGQISILNCRHSNVGRENSLFSLVR